MQTWNVVATVRGSGYRDAVRQLEPFGRVKRTRFHNVLVADVEDPEAMLERLETRGGTSLASVIPVRRTFEFRSTADFEAKARAILDELAFALSSKSFHVRVHHRGALGMSSRDEERSFDIFLLDALERLGLSGRVGFDDPDVIIAVEIVGSRCGISIWNKQELHRHPLLHLD